MKSFPKILQAEAIEPYTIRVIFDDNSTKYYNMNRLLADANFRRLANYDYFKNFRISVGGYGIEWDDELDLSEAELWENSEFHD